MSAAKTGDTVKVHYTGTLEDGTQFDSSIGQEPLEFELGAAGIITGFSSAVEGMTVGESKTVTIVSQEAYGPRNPEMIQEIPRSNIPDDIEIQIGVALSAQSPDGQVLHFQVTAFDDDNVTLDGNHPLADKDLTFQLELVEIC